MKKFLASALILGFVSSNAFAATESSTLLRNTTVKVKAEIDKILTNLGARSTSATEADALIEKYLLRSSTALEQTIDHLDTADAAYEAFDFEGYTESFALGCNRVAAARAQISNAGRRALYIGSTYPDASFLTQQSDDIKDTRDAAFCPT